ncbi:molybdopterin/thiamine biosynthesis adenylyltransferase [Gellertiella hungarica]|uniref:Molybdopterin/thiamine biosynthesis adenylyltransferase n=1 Tax=Gellertiella hungarica TaxID=1572859 RepID=A0A7W6NM30_9HYPH|nr:molybdopterin/thiamine biosynthesis adenylyltransferase [Gellertiella hungarica]
MFALHSPSVVPGKKGCLVSATQNFDHFEYVKDWNRARRFSTIDDALRAKEGSRHIVNPISLEEWERL